MTTPAIAPSTFTRDTSATTLDRFNQQLRISPAYQTWMAQNGIRTDRPIKLSKQQRESFAAYLTSQGLTIPKDFHIDEAGNLNQTANIKKRVTIAAIIGGAVAAPYLIGALGAGGAAAGAGATGAAGPAGAGAAGAAGAGAAGGAGAATGAAVAGTAAAAGSSSLWGRIAGTLVETGIPVAANLLGTKIATDAQKEAAALEAAGAKEALDWQKQVYAERQRQLAPSIGVGNAATVRLSELMGIPTPAGGYQPNLPQDGGGAAPGAPSTPAIPQPQPQPPQQAVPRNPTSAQPVPMRAPNGQVSLVPFDQVPHFEQRGAVRVS